MTTISKKNDKVILKENYDEIADNDVFYNKDMVYPIIKKLLEKNNRSEQFDFLYPNIDDPEFNIKFLKKKNLMKINMMVYTLEFNINKLCD